MHDLKDGQKPIISGPVQNGRTHLFVLAGIVFLALFLRIWNLAGQSLEWDDYNGLAGLAGGDLLETVRLSRLLNPEGAPLYHIVQYFAQFVVGRGEMAMRGLSVFIGVLSIPVLFATGRRLFGSGAALFAALLFALSPQHIFHDQSIRNYPLSVLMALCALYSFVRFLENEEELWLAANVLFGTLLVWTHLLGSMFLLAQGLAMLLAGRKWLKWAVLWALSQGIMLVPVLSWILTFPVIPETAYWVFHAPDLGKLLTGVLGFDSLLLNLEIAPPPAEWMICMPGGGTLSLATMITVSSMVIMQLFAIALFNGLLRKVWNSPGVSPASHLVPVVFALIPPFALAVLSHVWQPIYFNRYFLFSTPAFYLLAGALCFTPRRRAVGVACAFLLAVSYAVQATVAVRGTTRTPWKQAGRHLLENAKTGDQILVGGVGDAYANLGILTANMPPCDLPIAPAHTVDAAVVKALWHLKGIPIPKKSGKVGFITNLLWEDRLAKRFEDQLSLTGLAYSRIDFFANERISIWWITDPSAGSTPLNEALTNLRKSPLFVEDGVDFGDIIKQLPPGLDLERAYWALRMIQDDGEWPGDGPLLLMRLALDCMNEGFFDVSAALMQAAGSQCGNEDELFMETIVKWRAAMFMTDYAGAESALVRMVSFVPSGDRGAGAFIHAARALTYATEGKTGEAALSLENLKSEIPEMYSRLLPIINYTAGCDMKNAQAAAVHLRTLVPETSWMPALTWKLIGLENWICPSELAFSTGGENSTMSKETLPFSIPK